jgi:hypothetical protein
MEPIRETLDATLSASKGAVPAWIEAQDEPLRIGARTFHEVTLRVRELKARLHPTPADRRELFRLTEFLKSVAPRDGRTPEAWR